MNKSNATSLPPQFDLKTEHTAREIGMLDLTDLRCPVCLGHLDQSGDAATCASCNRHFGIRDGIVDFRTERTDYYFNPVPRKDMARLIAGMTPENWPRIIREFVYLAHNNPSWIDNLVVDGRYAWKLLLNLRADTKLLDLGCGLGNLTHNLAPLVGRVYALDLTYERLQFSRKRFSLFNPTDEIMTLAGGDGVHLPFADNSLDCVVLSGVLEWVGEGDSTSFTAGGKLGRLARMIGHHFGRSNPRQIQLRFLREIRRILKPAGQLFVAIENRLNHEYFNGRRDHHSHLYYGSLLPRFAANLYSILAQRRPYRTYTYSIPGYTSLMQEAGFPETEFLGLSEGYSSLKEIMPAKVVAPKWRETPALTLRDRIKRNRYFVPAYGIISSREPTPWPRREDGLLRAAEQHLRASIGDGELHRHSYTITGKDKLVIRGSFGNSPVILRIPLNNRACIGEQNNVSMLLALRKCGVREGSYPMHFASGEVDGVWYSVEEGISGRALGEHARKVGRSVVLPAIADVLALLRSTHSPAHRIVLENAHYATHVTKLLEPLLVEVSNPTLRRRIIDAFAEKLYGAETPLGIAHGDLGSRNVLVRHDGTFALIDWELGCTQGIPILDAINYLQSIHLAFNPDLRMPQIMSLFARGQWADVAEREFLSAQYRSMEMDPSRHEGWVYANWLRMVNHQMISGRQFDQRFIEREVMTVLKSISS